MDGDSAHDKPHFRRRSWCCSFAVPPRSPEFLTVSHPKRTTPHHKSDALSKSALSFPNSPQSTKSGFGLVGRIDPRRILSPGRVSPIDSDPTVDSIQEISPEPSPPIGSGNAQLQRKSSEKVVPTAAPPEPEEGSPLRRSSSSCSSNGGGLFDVRLNLKGKNGGCLVLELNSEVLSANSTVFADLILDCRKGLSSSAAASKICRIEVPDVENLGVFRETIELMFEEDITKRLLKSGVYRSIDILEDISPISRHVTYC